MKIAILNDIHVGIPLQFKNLKRAASDLVENHLPPLLRYIQETHQPDLLVNLGDLIRSQGAEHDLSHYQRVIKYFCSIKTPQVHLVGNHELKCTPVQAIEEVWEKHGFQQKSYGSQEFEEAHVVWLGLEIRDGQYKRRVVPEEQVLWLKDFLGSVTKPVFILTHTPLDEQNVAGNFFFETFDARRTEGFFIENSEALRQIILACPHVKAVFQAHLHYFHCKMIGHIPFITCPAMGDNICGPNAQDHVPEIYTLLDFEGGRFTAKAYAREFCFAGFEH